MPALGISVPPLLRVVLADLPEAGSVFGQPSPAWDERLGGKLGPGRWRCFEDGPPSSPRLYGTTCEVVLVAWCALAGWPREAINRPHPDGYGFVVGKHLEVLRQGVPREWILPPDLAAGDAYVSQHPTTVHVGVVLSTWEEPDGWRAETADAGQQDAQGRQCATRQVRRWDPERRTLTSGGAPCPLLYVLREE